MICILAMAVLILDSKTALASAREGVQLCLQTVIPSLFPLIVLSGILNGVILGAETKALSPIAKLLHIPQRAVSILMVGFLGGYPMGASCVAAAVKNGAIAKRDGERMLAFCSNCGPAFIFGMGMQLFPRLWICFIAWGIHILSALITGMLTGGYSTQDASSLKVSSTSVTHVLQSSVKVMASICGWVVIFRVLIGFADRWILWSVPNSVHTMIAGILEISNGVCMLGDVAYLGERLVLFCFFISFGGLCVWLQTVTVCERVSTLLYFPGKLTQGAISVLLSICAQPLFSYHERCQLGMAPIAICAIVCVIFARWTKKCAKSIGKEQLAGV